MVCSDIYMPSLPPFVSRFDLSTLSEKKKVTTNQMNFKLDLQMVSDQAV